MVSQSARRRWLASVTEAEPSKESVQAIAANLLVDVGQMNQQLHMSSARLQVLATAAAAAGVDPNAVFGKPLFVFKSVRSLIQLAAPPISGTGNVPRGNTAFNSFILQPPTASQVF